MTRAMKARNPDNTVETVVLQCINDLGGKASSKEIYQAITDYVLLSENDLRASFGKRPQYHNELRGYFSILTRKHKLDRLKKGEFRLTQEGLLSLDPLNRPLPKCADLDDLITSPGRVATTISRILRDPFMVRELKKKYKHRCQLCGTGLELPNRFLYCEAHHIRPLGKPHDGHDEESNLLIVCPNHHVLLDYGAMKLSQTKFRFSNHDIAIKNIEYHNRWIYKGV